MRARRMQIGERVSERYRVDRRAGAGAMGLVFRGTDLADGRPVAIKVLRDPWGDTLARFRREAEVLAALRHPRIVGYLAHGATADGEAFLVMEWLEGESLKDRLARAPLSSREIVAVGRGVAEALGAAHARGIVHRDLKPANVFLCGGAAEVVKVVDFGLARGGAGDRTRTAAGAMLGTPAYMAPEQALGQAEVDARADLFSLGAILFECVTGRTPFERDSVMAVLLALTTQSAPPVASVAIGTPPMLAALVDRLLASSPAARPSDARAIAEELAALERAGSLAGWTPRPVPPSGPTLLPAESTGASLPPTSTPTAHPALAPGQGAPPVTAPPTAERSASPLLFFGAGALLLASAGFAALWLWRSEIVAAHTPRSAEVTRPADDACPAGALACEAFRPDDPHHVDGFAAIGRALALAKKVRDDAEFADATMSGVGEGGLDLDAGATLLVNTTRRLSVQLRARTLIVWNGPVDSPRGTLPGCSLREAYGAARRAGLPARPEANMVVSARNGPATIAVVVVDGPKTKQILLDIETCAPR